MPVIQRHLTILLLWLVGLGAAAQFAKVAVPFAQVRSLYPDAGDSVGWLLSIVSLLGAILGIVFGDLVARIGEKRILLLGVVLGAALSIGQSALLTFEWMLLTRVLEGLSHLAIVVAAPTLIAQISGDRLRPLAMAFWSTFFGVTFALFAWVILPLFQDQSIGRLFGTHGVYMGIAAVLIGLFIPSGFDAQNRPKTRNVIATHLRAYTTAKISTPAVGWLFYTLTFVSLLALLPDHLPPENSDRALGLMPLFSIATSLFIVPIIAARHSSMRAIFQGFILGIGIILFAMIWDLRTVLTVVFFGVIGLVQGGSFAAVPELNEDPEDQALAYGFMAQMGNVGNLLGTPLLLLTIQMGGASAMFVTVALLYAIAVTALSVLLLKTKASA